MYEKAFCKVTVSATNQSKTKLVLRPVAHCCGPLSKAALTDCELSLLLSLDLFFASLFFFLCRGLDSRIISSSSKVGSQCRRPFC